ncbi:MAG: alpha,alpha-trehalose-phosphate synthase (UDP-forming) [Gaiellaceae bacterium]
MGKRREIIIVSNRGPVTFQRGPGQVREARRGGGGLVTALGSLALHHDVTWIASAMSDVDRELAEENDGRAVEDRLANGADYHLRLLAHERSAYDQYYNVVANPTLWFAQHSLWDLIREPDYGRSKLLEAWRDGYTSINAAFAEAALEELSRRPEAIVFFNDYHLYLAPRLVRARAPDAALLQFVHIPWPELSRWHVLPGEINAAIHDGLLANDVVGFHTTRWRSNFIHSAQSIAGAERVPGRMAVSYGGATTCLSARAISIDPEELAALAEDPKAQAHELRIVETRPEFLVVRVDRTDPSKNIVTGFRAYELFLERHPELRGRVSMLSCLDPSRLNIPEYEDYLEAIQGEALRINERFQQPGWTPIDLQIEDDVFQSIAAYKQYDALFVNAVSDGLNLVAKEAPLANERDGVLILSENTGAHEELGPFSLTIDPYDISDQADAIYEALTMPAAVKRHWIEGTRSWVREHDLSWWIDGLLHDLDNCLASGAPPDDSGARPEDGV